jgi:hypothetical protein
LEIGLLQANLVENILLATEHHRRVLIISGVVRDLVHIKKRFRNIDKITKDVHAALDRLSAPE